MCHVSDILVYKRMLPCLSAPKGTLSSGILCIGAIVISEPSRETMILELVHIFPTAHRTDQLMSGGEQAPRQEKKWIYLTKMVKV